MLEKETQHSSETNQAKCQSICQTARECQELNFTTHDGVSIFYRYWPAISASNEHINTDNGAILLFHRGHEHSGRIMHLVDELNLPNQAFFAWDARGHGLTEGERGDSPSFSTSVRDVQTFVDHIKLTHHFSTEQLSIIAQSVGAVLLSTWVHDYAPNIRSLVLASPAFKIKLYVPFAIPGLQLLQKIKGNFFVNSYVKAKFLTHDPERMATYDTDPLIARPISVNVLLGLYKAAKRVVEDAYAIKVPTQILSSGSDFVVKLKPQKQFFQNLGSVQKEHHVLPGFYHDTLGEKDRGIAVERIRRFITSNIQHPIPTVNLLHADTQGAGVAESESLATTLPPKSLVGRYWQLTRAGLKLGDGLSQGVQLGFETGFDSGSTLDYVYQNEPRGKGEFGKFVDKQYLNSMGWRGIRRRKVHIEELLLETLQLLQSQNQPANLLDIAAGHGRYLLETIHSLENGHSDMDSTLDDHLSQVEQKIMKPESVLLRDYSDINIEKGRQLIESFSLQDIVRFEKGDAFDFESLASIEPKPNLASVSGLYELFSDNEMVSRSLAGVASALQSGGYLIYTNQPWHPQLEFIARALTSHRDGNAWVMRRRSQLEMDQLVQEAGFEKIAQRIDEWGIFTVSLARKII